MLAFFVIAALLVVSVACSARQKVVVSGAGGQTGQHVFRKLLARQKEFATIGVVRSQESKQALLATGIPDESVIVADITDENAIRTVIEGCDALMICSSAKPAPSGKTDEASGRPIFGFPNGSNYISIHHSQSSFTIVIHHSSFIIHHSLSSFITHHCHSLFITRLEDLLGVLEWFEVNQLQIPYWIPNILPNILTITSFTLL